MLLTLDLETSVDCNVEGQMKASPHYAGNNIVLAGFAIGSFEAKPVIGDVKAAIYQHIASGSQVTLCGFNVGFDLAYLLRDKVFSSVILENISQIKVWDVQQAAYLLSAQMNKYPSLDEVCKQYGLPVKDDKIKAYWDSGMRTEDIPAEELQSYLEHDVSVTHLLAFKTIADMTPEMKELCFIKGYDILCTALMEQAGMAFDLQLCGQISDEVRAQVVAVKEKLVGLVRHETSFPCFEPTKLKEVQTILYGGVLKREEKRIIGKFKTGLRAGQDKYGTFVVEQGYDGILSPVTKLEAAAKFGHSVDDKALQWILANEDPRNHLVGTFIGDLMNFREWFKDVSTYYDGYSRLCWEDGMIRPSFQHVSTVTGRLSCTKPNLQNVSKEDK